MSIPIRIATTLTLFSALTWPMVNEAPAQLAVARSHVATPLLERPARLEVHGIALPTALGELQRRSGVTLAFSPSLLGGAGAVTCVCRLVTVGEALDRILAGTSFRYEEIDGLILVERQRMPQVQRQLRGTESLALLTVAAMPASAPIHKEVPPTAARDESFQPWQAHIRTGDAAVGSIRGRVTVVGSQAALSGVQVFVIGTGRGALTNAAGEYVISGVAEGQQRVRAEMIGFQTSTQTVNVVTDQVVIADFALVTAAVTLDQIVVTGTAGAVSKRTLGNAITVLDVDDAMKKAADLNVTELLQAKAPGVTVLHSSGNAGAAGNIRIRGIGSLSGTSAPVVYVDGVRVASNAAGGFRNNWLSPAPGQVSTGGQTNSALDMINPNNIESIEVLKGPAAATLYGADAANGVIQIITKKGKPGQQKLQWTAKTTYGAHDWGVDTRTTYTTCTAERINDPDGAWQGCEGKAVGTVLSENFLPRALRDGQVTGLSLSARGGGDGYSFFAAAQHDEDEGVFANNTDQHTDLRSNFSFYPSQKVDFSINVGFNQTKTSLPPGDNGTSLVNAVWTYAPGRTPGRNETYGFGIATPEEVALYESSVRGDRTTLGATLNYRPFSWLTNRFIVGADINSRTSRRYLPPTPVWGDGQLTSGAPRDNIYSVDYAGTITNTISPTLSSSFSVGAQYIDREFRNTVAQGNRFATTLVKNVTSATDRTSWDEHLSVKSLGFFGQEQIAWRDRLYLTAALRMDNSSIFGSDVQELFYPKFSVSYIATESEFFKKYGWLDNLKLRAAMGQAGNAPLPFARTTGYGLVQTVDPVSGEIVSALRISSAGNPEVKPERGSEIEVGFDASFWHNRAGLEFTYYNKTTKDALMQVPVAPSELGLAGTIYKNLGEINNRGFELSLVGTPVSTRQLVWDTRVGISTNKNKLVSFGYDQAPINYCLTTCNQRTVEGYPIAGYWVHDPVWSAELNKYVPSEARFLGPALPTREVSFSNTITLFSNISVFALADYKGGNYLLDQTGQVLCASLLCREVNDPSAPAEQRAKLSADLNANDALYTYKADFIKLREVSVTYTVPTSATRRFGADRVAVTLAGHNMGFLWKPDYKGLDPEVSFNGLVDAPVEDGQAFPWVRLDFFTVPMTRRMTASVSVSF